MSRQVCGHFLGTQDGVHITDASFEQRHVSLVISQTLVLQGYHVLRSSLAGRVKKCGE